MDDELWTPGKLAVDPPRCCDCINWAWRADWPQRHRLVQTICVDNRDPDWGCKHGRRALPADEQEATGD